MKPEEKKHWQQTAALFDERAEEYDRWYEDSLVFAVELAALRSIRTRLPGPRLEIGTGPGRFAAALGVETGIDPAMAPLLKARSRGITGIRAIGEQIPLVSGSMGSLYLILTLCFLARPDAVLGECRRVLRPDGRLILGVIPAGSSWGRLLAAKGAQGHPYYRFARFLSLARVTTLLTENRFSVMESRSTLFQSPDSLKEMEKSKPGLDEQAGFCVLVAG